MRPWLDGVYGLRLYLPLSGLARRWRRFSRRLRGKQARGLQDVNLPVVRWQQCTDRRIIPVREARKANGNVRISELGILNMLAADCRDGSTLFEIGTFDGRTTLNMAFSAPADCQVVTLDLPPDMETALPLAPGERHMVDKPWPGQRIEAYRRSFPDIVSRIEQHFGDSASFDFSPWYDRCDLVFVDASHAYDYVLSDSREAMQLVRGGGVIVWHDYGIWEGVTRALEDLDREQALGLRVIAGTSLAWWRKPLSAAS